MFISPRDKKAFPPQLLIIISIAFYDGCRPEHGRKTDACVVFEVQRGEKKRAETIAFETGRLISFVYLASSIIRIDKAKFNVCVPLCIM